MTSILETNAALILAGRTDLDSATIAVAKTTKQSQAKVRISLTDAVSALEAAAEAKAEAKAAKAIKPAAKPRGPGATVRGGHIEPAAFAAKWDGRGLSNKEVAAALLAAGMGNTLSRVTELTHSKGGSEALFAKYSAAIDDYPDPRTA